ncbi:MAG: hypothetical protein U0235_10425 [Polyangiaceae bacterium]
MMLTKVLVLTVVAAPTTSRAEQGASDSRSRDEYVDVGATASISESALALGLALQYRFPPQIAAGLTGRTFVFPALPLEGVPDSDGGFVSTKIRTTSIAPSVRWDFVSSAHFRLWLGAEAGPSFEQDTGIRRSAVERFVPDQRVTWGLMYGVEGGLAVRPHEVFSVGVQGSTHRDTHPFWTGAHPILVGFVIAAHVPIRKRDRTGVASTQPR